LDCLNSAADRRQLVGASDADLGLSLSSAHSSADVAAAYFQLRELDLDLEISRRTLASRRDFAQLTKRWQRRGPRPCSMFGKRSSLVFTEPKPFRIWNDELSSQENFLSHSSRKQSRSDHTWNEVDRAAAAA